MNQILVFEKYIETLKKWQKHINLISNTTINDIYNRHIIDGINLFNYIKNNFPENNITLDIGSGAGFPGLVLGIMGLQNITLVESDARKCAFLNTIKTEYNLDKIKIENSRIEDIQPYLKVDIITSRAFKSIKETFDLTENLIHKDINYILIKGKTLQSEIDEAFKKYSFDFSFFKNNSSTDGYIIHIKNIIKL